MSDKKVSRKLADPKGMQRSAKSATAIGRAVRGFTDEERAAMRERVQELEAGARGPGGR